jgi:hypothetical protein
MKNRFVATALLILTGIAVMAQPGTFYSRGIGGGGALFFPSVNPVNEYEFYVSCDMSELFHSVNLGHSYTEIPFSKLQVFGTSTYEFTNNDNLAYCNFNDGNEGFPVRTVDGGNTWTTLSGYDVSQYGHVYTLRANYSNPSQLIIGAYGDILISNDGGSSFSLVKHTVNMGAGLIVGGVFWDGNDIFIGTNEGLLHSNNAGVSFAMIPTTGMASGQVIWSFAGADNGVTKRFVCIAANAADTYNGIMPWDYWNYAKGVYVMDNASGTWVSRSAGINFANDFVMYVAMGWEDINTIYLGGHDNALYSPLVLKSQDGGNTWAKKFNTTNNANIITGWEGYNGDKDWSWSETCFGISVSPFNSSRVFFGSFSNVEISSNGGETWRQAYVDSIDQHPPGASTPKNQAYHSIGLENTTCWQVHWQDANTMIGCFSDIGGIRSLDAGISWGYQYSGFSVNTLYRVAMGNDGKIYGACSNIHDIYQSTRLADAQLDAADANGKIVWSSDNGGTWSTLHTFGHPVYWLATDPNDANTMYASVIHFGGTQGSQQGGIYVTHDLGNLAGSSWTKLANPPRTEGHPACISVLNDGKVVCTFSGRRNSSGSFTASSGVFLYNPALSSWTDVSDPGMYYWTQDIIVDPGDALQNTWYVCVYSGWGGPANGLGGLYRTTNRGSSWSKLTGTQFDRVTSLTFDPGNPDQSYLSTETQGLWISGNMNSTPAWSMVASYPFRQPQRVFFNPYDQKEIWVTSFGNGMKVGYLDSIAGITIFPAIGKGDLAIFPNPGNGRFEVRTGTDMSHGGDLEVYSLTGSRIFSEKLSPGPGGSFPVILDKIASGIYLVRLKTQGAVLTSKLVIR